MRKKGLKMLSLGLAGAMLFSTAVMAAPSPKKNGTVSQKFTINGQEADPEKFQASFDTKLEELNLQPEVLDTILEINKNPEKAAEVIQEAKVPEGDTIDVSKLEILTEVQDLSIIDKETGKIMEGAKDVTITWEVPALVEDMGEVRVLHYSRVRNLWEILKPESVDFTSKSVTQHFEDLSPVAVVYVPKAALAGNETKADSAQTSTDVKTGDSSHVWLYVVIAAAAVAVLFTVAKGRKKN